MWQAIRIEGLNDSDPGWLTALAARSLNTLSRPRAVLLAISSAINKKGGPKAALSPATAPTVRAPNGGYGELSRFALHAAQCRAEALLNWPVVSTCFRAVTLSTGRSRGESGQWLISLKLDESAPHGPPLLLRCDA